MSVKFDQHIDIDAPPDTVWGILTNLKTWPMWFPDLEQLSNASALEVGGTFQWSSGGQSGSGAIVSVDQTADRITVVTRLGNSEVTHTFDVDRSGGFLGIGGNDSRLRYTMEYDPPGGFLGDFVAGGNPKDILKVKHTLAKVKGLAEDR